MGGNKRWCGLLLAVCLTVALLVPPRGRALAQTQGVLRFIPQPLAAEEGTSFSVEVWAERVSNVYGFQAFIDFDPHILEVVRIEAGPFLNPGWKYFEYDNNLGQMTIAIVQVAPSPPANGSGPLARIVFRAKASGESKLDFVSRSEKLHTYICDGDGRVIPTEQVDGLVTVYAAGSVPAPGSTGYRVLVPLLFRG
jgi:hypothetical protein